MKYTIIILLFAHSLLSAQTHEPYKNQADRTVIDVRGQEYQIYEYNFDTLLSYIVDKEIREQISLLSEELHTLAVETDMMQGEITALTYSIDKSIRTRDLINSIGYTRWSSGDEVSTGSEGLSEDEKTTIRINERIGSVYQDLREKCKCDDPDLSDLKSRYTWTSSGDRLDHIGYGRQAKSSTNENTLWEVFVAWRDNGMKAPLDLLDYIKSKNQ